MIKHCGFRCDFAYGNADTIAILGKTTWEPPPRLSGNISCSGECLLAGPTQ